MSACTVAVVYGTSAGGGLGDVGKYAAAHALSAPDVVLRPIAMTSRATAPPSFETEVDVYPHSLQKELKAALKDVQPAHIVVEDDDAQDKLEAEMKGVDVVIACVGNRQPGYKFKALRSRWCERGSLLVTAAMTAQGVKRLILLSSFAVAENFELKTHAKTIGGLALYMCRRALWHDPLGFFKGLWGGITNNQEEAIKQDVIAMENVVRASGVDYVLVRVSGLLPESPPVGRWKLLETTEGVKLTTDFFRVAKSDVGLYMLQEAVKPSLHCTSIVLGGDPK